jgi:hypothetical protein
MTHQAFAGTMRAPLDHMGQRNLPDRLTAHLAAAHSTRCEARARLIDCRAAGVLYRFRRSSSHQTQIPIPGITSERRSR